MFKIGEFSKLTQVSVRMLRYYDEVDLLKPALIDKYSGYRMYDIDQIPLLNKIIYLRDSGFNVAEISLALKDKENSQVLAQLDKKYVDIQKNIASEEQKLKKIILAKQELQQGKDNLYYNITLKAVPSYHVVSLRRVIPDYYAEGLLWKELAQYAKEQHLTISDQTFTIYHDEDYREKEVDVEVCTYVEETRNDDGDYKFYHTEAVPYMATTMVYGDFTNIAGVYQSFAKWLNKNSNFKMGNTSRQIVHRGPWNENDPKKYLIEIQIPLQSFE